MNMPTVLNTAYESGCRLKMAAEGLLIRATVDVESLLSGSGASDDSLSGVSDAVDSYGKGAFSIGQKLAIYVAAIAFIIFFAGLMLNAGNAQKRSEKKEAAPTLIIGGIGIFAVAAILVFLQKIGGNLF